MAATLPHAPGRRLCSEDGPAEAVYATVRRIPAGRVLAYGEVAELAASRVGPRDVGRMMAFAPPGVPWWRVVGADGALPIARRDPLMAAEQRQRLLSEGVVMGAGGRIDMSRYRWDGEAG